VYTESIDIRNLILRKIYISCYFGLLTIIVIVWSW